MATLESVWRDRQREVEAEEQRRIAAHTKASEIAALRKRLGDIAQD